MREQHLVTLAPKLLLAAAAALFVAGVGLTIVQPGDLGDDDRETAQATSTTTSTTASETTTSTTADDTDDTDDTGATTTTVPGTGAGDGDGTAGDGTAGDGTAGDGDGTAGGGSGLDGSGAAEPVDTADGLADTGGTSFLVAGLLATTVGLALRRRVT